jgi:MFS family permease
LGYAWYVVIVLTALYMLSFVDRTILSLLVGSIKRDLGISDTRIGLLQGLSFALFYTIMGLPLGRLADTRSRRNLIAACVVVWSFFTGRRDQRLLHGCVPGLQPGFAGWRDGGGHDGANSHRDPAAARNHRVLESDISDCRRAGAFGCTAGVHD